MTGNGIPYPTPGALPNNHFNSVCVLTRVAGKFAGAGETVRLIVLDSASQSWSWSLTMGSQQQGVGASAYCFDRRAFLATGDARWVGDFETRLPDGNRCRSANVGTWWGDAATMINGLGGNWAGLGESVTVTQSSSGFTPSVLRPQTCQLGMQASATTFFAGTPHVGQVARFWGPRGQGPANVAGEWEATVTYGQRSVQMAPTGEAMCYFTHIAGKFRGGAESAEIVPTANASGVEVWTLVVKSRQNGITARSLCYKRDQRQ